MERYNKYFVLKNTDIEAFLTTEQQITLSALATKIEVHRLNEGKKPQQYVCVAADWPMYEDVWKMVEAFVDGKSNEIESLRTQVAELRTENERIGSNVSRVQSQFDTVSTLCKRVQSERDELKRQRDEYKAALEKIAFSRVGAVDSVTQELFDREKWAEEALAATKGEALQALSELSEKLGGYEPGV